MNDSFLFPLLEITTTDGKKKKLATVRKFREAIKTLVSPNQLLDLDLT